MLDEDVLDRALAVHELEQRDVLGLEPHVQPGAAIATLVLQRGVRRSVAAVQVSALRGRARTRRRPRVPRAFPGRLPGADPPRRRPFAHEAGALPARRVTRQATTR